MFLSIKIWISCPVHHHAQPSYYVLYISLPSHIILVRKLMKVITIYISLQTHHPYKLLVYKVHTCMTWYACITSYCDNIQTTQRIQWQKMAYEVILFKTVLKSIQYKSLQANRILRIILVLIRNMSANNLYLPIRKLRDHAVADQVNNKQINDIQHKSLFYRKSNESEAYCESFYRILRPSYYLSSGKHLNLYQHL